MPNTEPTIEDRSGRLKVCIATITRRRPKMVGNLLASWASLAMPAGCDCFFAIVENDDKPGFVPPAGIRNRHGEDIELVYRCETEQGIPIARNRAVEIALERGADVLLFIDDDEVAAEDWLVKLVEAYRAGDASLIGGPVRAIPPDESLSWRQQVVFSGVKDRLLRSEKRSARRVQNGSAQAITIVTNNWLADMRLFRRHGLSFDRRLRFSGGSDAKLSSDVKALGLKVGWVPDAVVFETTPTDRLTLSYQYRRGRDQSNASFRRNIAKSRYEYLSLAASVPIKMFGAAFLVVAIPFTSGSSLVPLVRTIGWIVGRVSVFLGQESTHYTSSTGS
jgi:glycosyltransferase involved in cell wall biosynthesis